jgi:site-specific recombinase XerD
MEMVVLLPRDLESTSPHDPTWSLVIAAFLQERGSRTGSRRTVETYARILRRFLRTVADPAAVTPLDVHCFVHAATQDARPPAPSTILTRLAAVGGFFSFAVRMRALEANPAAVVGRPLVRASRPRGLTGAEIGRLLSVIPETPVGLLDRALVITAVLTGLRRTELVSLRLAGTADRDRVFCEVRTKGGAVRRCQLPDPAWKAIVAAAEARGVPIPSEGERPFSVSDSTWYAHLRRYAAVAGLAGVSPHVLRHTAAKLRREGGASIEAVCGLLGHRSIATTAIYLRRLEDEADDGWQGVAQTLGLGSALGGPTPEGGNRTSAGPHLRSRPEQVARRGGCANSRLAIWRGAQASAPHPRSDRTAARRRHWRRFGNWRAKARPA